MSVNLYFSLLPEALVASMLGPEDFGAYLATGTAKQPHGQAMFFQVKPGFTSDYFDLTDAAKRCVPHPNGDPKHSLYLATYRVLEHVPVSALDDLWLFTAHGRGLKLTRGSAPATPDGSRYHLYRELCPVHPLIASSMNPLEFCKFITDTSSHAIAVPRICFVDLALAGMAEDPRKGQVEDLPYHNIDHIRHCLAELDSGKVTKTVDRVAQQGILYRCIKSGFYVGDQKEQAFYAYPSRTDLEGVHHVWWRCTNDSELQHAGWSV